MKAKIMMIISLITIISNIYAQNGFKYKRITVFKDGSSYIEKEIVTGTKNKTIHFDDFLTASNKVTDAAISSSYSVEDEKISLGTLKISAENNEILESVVNKNNKDSILRDFTSLLEFLTLNVGKKVKVTSSPEPKQTVYTIKNVVDNTLVLQSDNNISFVPIISVLNLEFVDKPLTKAKYINIAKGNTISLELKLQNDYKNQKINLSYLQKGITWLPTYFIGINEQKKGKLILEANLLNDIEDIENTDVNFAVGVPSFAFKSVSEPLVSGKSVWEILRQLNAQQLQEYSEGIQMNMMSQQSNYRNTERAEDFTPNAEGKGGEDLYFYKKQNISLNKNGRLKTQLLTMDFDYEDVYSCELDQNATNSNYEKKSKINPVWHSIRFKNSSNQPLTTGTVFFRKEDKGQLSLISQNQLDYTPANEFVTAKIAVAPDIMVSSKDVEVERKLSGTDFLLSIDGEISIVNYKSFPVEMIVNRKIIGTMLNSDLAWKVSSNFETYNARNTSNQVSWKLKVDAGKTVQIKYKYKILVD